MISRTHGAGITENIGAGVPVGYNAYVNNLVWSSPVAISIGPSSTVTGTLAADPMFIAPASGDYRVESDSPAIDKGTTRNAPSTDVDGLPRRNSGRYDVGAYER